MDANTPNLHTPPEGHAPPPPHQHSHGGEDMELALAQCDCAGHEEPPLVILDRRFAKGEITKEVYSEAKGLLLKH